METTVIENAGATVVEKTPEQIAHEAMLAALVTPGKKGVTNAQMIPVMKAAIMENDTDKLAQLKQYFPGVYVSSTKYLGKENIAKLEALQIA
jgi:hypothetical protein